MLVGEPGSGKSHLAAIWAEQAGYRIDTEPAGDAFRVHGLGLCHGLDPNRREFRGGPKPLRREHCLGKVETEELVGTVFVGVRHTGPHQERGAEDGS